MAAPEPRNPLERRSLRLPNERHGPSRFLTQATLEFLQIWFSKLYPDGERFHYSDEPSERGLLIADKGAYLVEDRGRVPALIVKRGAQRFRRQGGINNMQALDLRTGKKTHADLQSGSVIIHCFGEARSLEAEDLGCLVFDFFNSLQDRLRKYGLFKINAAELGQEQQVIVGGEERILLVPVTIVAEWQRAWVTQENAPTVLARVLFDVAAC